MKRIIYGALALGTFVSACRPKDIDINVEPATPKLVVFSHVIPNNIMLISLTKSFSALKPQEDANLADFLVNGATIEVEFDNHKVPFYELEYGLYASFETPTNNETNFKLTAIKDGDTITAESLMLPKVSFQNAEPVITKTASDTTVGLHISFDDNPNTKNWYLINVYKKTGTLPTGAIDPVNFFDNGTNTLIKTELVADIEIQGKYDKILALDDVKHTDSIAVTLSNISGEYYQYLTLRVGNGNIFTNLNLEPVNYPTNVKNGYGFFNTHWPDVAFYDLGEF